ncbi:MAG: hypothetical protein GY797_21585 [Deltaproteobacteria bacterium]|nr:hypothetical protein [Deltaproteobacteria bacterium]
MNKTVSSKQKKYAFNAWILWSIIIFCGFLGLIYGYQYDDNRAEDYNKKTLKTALEKYPLIKETDLSEVLYDSLIKLIMERKKCFASQTSYDDRSKTCKRAYITEVVMLARRHIQSAPMRGLFIRCVSECPITGSLCSGEEGSDETTCIETEARCIEFCLDEFWRGGSLPDGENYIYKKRN